MVIEKKDNQIIFRLPADIGVENLQKIKNLIEYKILIGKSKAKPEEIENLSEEMKKKWWDENKFRFNK